MTEGIQNLLQQLIDFKILEKMRKRKLSNPSESQAKNKKLDDIPNTSENQEVSSMNIPIKDQKERTNPLKGNYFS